MLKLTLALKKCLLLLLLALSFITASSQKKYQGLLWEITGNGLQKPSYLYGTMHVSSKLAFHLGDSFFTALNSADMVALEINPETWVDDMLAYDPYAFMSDGMFYGAGNTKNKGLQRREAIIEALSSDPSLINHYLYRSHGYSVNFEEDTYLDLYIFQAGKKLKKQVTGLERMDQLMMLLDEAERARDEEYKYKKAKYNHDYDYEEGQPASFEEMLEDAYRRGDLDVIDSLNTVDGTPGYLENMLYKRNDLMASRMDTIMRIKKLALFAGMGASHLPGEKGVIEILRAKGYTVRPVTRGERDPRQKQKIDEMFITKKFEKQKSFDNYIEVDLPGRMYELMGVGSTRSYFHPDMANGAYYTITRIKTYGRELGEDPEYVLKSIDSLLYENIPGKIQKQKKIEKFGYKGFSITTRTRRGDIHRYEILVTPEEIFVFKLGGIGDFAKGKEADKFFKSITLNIPSKTDWKDFTSPDGMFTVLLPHPPLHYGDTSVLGIFYNPEPYSAIDFNTGNSYTLTKKYISESPLSTTDSVQREQTIFEFSEKNFWDVLERTDSRQGDAYITDARYRVDETYHMRVRYYIENGYVYILSAKYSKDSADAERFAKSLRLTPEPPVAYELHTDTLMKFSVTTTSQKESMDMLLRTMSRYKSRNKPYQTLHENKSFLEGLRNDEAVNVLYVRYGKYNRYKDSATFWEEVIGDLNPDSTYIILENKSYTKNGFDILDFAATDTGCDYAFKYRIMQRQGVAYQLKTLYNHKKGLGEFSAKFFETFAPDDTITGADIFSDNAPVIMADLGSADSATRAQARDYIKEVILKPQFFKQWTTMIDTLQPSNSEYFKYKSQLIEELKEIKTAENIKYLGKLYENSGDTNTFQLSALLTLLRMETTQSFDAFKKLLLQETPLGNNYEINSLFWNIDDSLELAAKLYPDLFKLYTLDEYREQVISLLAMLADSNKIEPQVYKDQVTILANEAKNELKRLAASEVEKDAETEEDYYGYNDYTTYNYNSGSYLGNLATVLLPFYDDKSVKNIFDRLLQVKDKYLRMQIAIKLLKNNHIVPDSVFENLAKDPEYRVYLYNNLEEIKKLEKFPAAYKNQDSMARATVWRNINTTYSKVDTIVLLGERFIEHKDKKGYAYLYKYRFEEGETWYLAMAGLQPADKAQVNAESYFLRAGRIKLDEKIPVEKQFNVLVKEEMFYHENSSNYDYAENYSEDYSSYEDY